MLDSDQPWPLKLIGASLNPYENESVIAYGYEEPGDGTGKIYIYDLNCPGQEQALYLRFHGQRQVTVESYDNSSVDSIRGFYCENYSHHPPPVIGGNILLRKILPLKSAWYLTRLMRLSWLWISACLHRR